MSKSGEDIFSRTRLLLGDGGMCALKAARVIVFGVGGVGSWCAEGLVRSGIGHITIVDNDRVAPSNINRQLPASSSTIGRVKVEVLKERLLEINPQVDVIAMNKAYTAENSSEFGLDSYDYIIDAIDSLKDKADLILRACECHGTLFSSMGAALKLNPQMVRVGEFWQVRGCPMGSAIRKKYRRNNTLPAKKFLCVYDEEVLEMRGASTETLTEGKAQLNGSSIAVTGVFGLTLCALVLQDIYKKA